jgi:hypothetical protein
MKDSNNEYSEEDRQRISKEAADILKKIKGMQGDNFTCGINQGLEKQKEHFENLAAFNESERRTRNILIGQLNKSNLLNVLSETSSLFKESNSNSTKYSVTSGESFLAEDGGFYSQINIQPKQPVFYNAKVGNKKDIELFALTITVQLLIDESDIKIEILSHFNPDIFRNVKIEYSGIVTTGVNRHIQLVLSESISTEELRNNIFSGLNESISYYFK